MGIAVNIPNFVEPTRAWAVWDKEGFGLEVIRPDTTNPKYVRHVMIVDAREYRRLKKIEAAAKEHIRIGCKGLSRAKLATALTRNQK